LVGANLGWHEPTAPTEVGIYQNRLPASGRRYPLQQPPHRPGRCQPWLARPQRRPRSASTNGGYRPAAGTTPAATDASPW